MQLWDLLPCLVMQEAPFSSRPRETLRKLTISQAHTGPPHLHSFQSNTLRNNDIPIVTRSSPICIFQQCYFNFQRVGNHSSVQGAGIQFKLDVSKILKEFRISESVWTLITYTVCVSPISISWHCWDWKCVNKGTFCSWWYL